MEQERAAESRTDILKVACSAADSVNIAFYQNAIPIIRELAIENELGRDLSGKSVHLAAEPPFLMPGIWRIERITDRATHHIRSLDLKLDPAFHAGSILPGAESCVFASKFQVKRLPSKR